MAMTNISGLNTDPWFHQDVDIEKLEYNTVDVYIAFTSILHYHRDLYYSLFNTDFPQFPVYDEDK